MIITSVLWRKNKKIIDIINKYSPELAVEEILLLFGERRWHIGEKVVVTHCIYGHEFENGVIVKIVDHKQTETSSWLCSDGKNSWWLSEDEGLLLIE